MGERTHSVKIYPDFFEPVLSGDKPFEVRRDDRGYQRGDLLRLREYRPPGAGALSLMYTGREMTKRITFVLTGGQWGIEPGFVVLGLEDVGDSKLTERTK